ncbi:MAG TPA: hypothetical protein VIF57_27640, partial [Polyangia bacterium]
MTQGKAKRWICACASALALLPAACATPSGTAGSAITPGVVTVTPPPEDATGFVLAAQTGGAPAAPASTPRPAP